MEDSIKKVLEQYKGQTIEFALEFEKSEGTLSQQLAKVFVLEMANKVKQEKLKFINELEQMVLVWNNVVLLGKLTAKREKLDEENSSTQ